MAVPSRVLLLHAPIAAGHTMAARALAEGLHAAGAQVYLEDALAFAPAWWRRLVMAYAWVGVHYLPRALGANYYLTSRHLNGPIDALRRWSHEMADAELVRFVHGLRPDAIVATYPLIAATLCQMRLDGRLRCPVFLAVTDRYAHRSWFEPGADGYFVEGETVHQQLVGYGVPEERIFRTGIPIRRGIVEQARALDREREGKGAPAGPANVLVAFGGWGNGPIETVVRSFAAPRPWAPARAGANGANGTNGANGAAGAAAGTARDVHVTVVCGRNRRVQARLREAQESGRLPYATIHGYVEDFPALLARADVVVTKPGGISVAEVFAAGRPLCLVHPDPGQEEANFVHALECGAALGIAQPEDTGPRVRALLGDWRRYQQLRMAGLAAAHPRAAEEAAAVLLAHARAAAVRRRDEQDDGLGGRDEVADLRRERAERAADGSTPALAGGRFQPAASLLRSAFPSHG
ncbi:MAG TPA: glycosyltransferase [Myxococcota bacterium]|nr:glycosyltransferase [Myxococcota bacterium]